MHPLKIAITGADGYIGHNLMEHLTKLGHIVHGIVRSDTKRDNFYKADITDRHSIFRAMLSIKPDVVIHTAGISSLSACEVNHELANEVNITGTENIVNAMQGYCPDSKLIFISSDYVFNGLKGDYTEECGRSPVTQYGVCKLQSEDYIIYSLKNTVIVRTANVYGRGGGFYNFLHNSLSLGKTIPAYTDTYYTPTFIDYLTDSIAGLISVDYRGIINVAGNENINRFKFAIRMCEAMGLDASKSIKPVEQPHDGLLAKDSSLNTLKLQKLLGNYCPSIRRSLGICMGNIIAPYCYHGDARGMIYGITHGLHWEEVNYIESVEGCIRGNHYHQSTVEAFYIITGRIKVTLKNISDGCEKNFIAIKGDIINVPINTVHTFSMIEDSQWINMLSKPIDPSDPDIHTV